MPFSTVYTVLHILQVLLANLRVDFRAFFSLKCSYITFEPKVAQRSVASQNDHKSKACLPEASNAAFTMYRRLKRRLQAPVAGAFLPAFF